MLYLTLNVIDQSFLVSSKLYGLYFSEPLKIEAGIVICILDALDECGERTRTSLLRHIGVLFSASQTSATVKFLITSRPNTTIEDALWESYPNVSSVRLMGENEHEVSTIQKEISLVIGKKVDKFKEKRQQCDIHDEAHHNILKRLAEIENRTYLWVSLIFAELDKSVRSNQGTLLQVIEAIPSSLQAAYERILSYSTNATKAKRLLHFVLAAQRPFTLEEMNTAIATTERCTSINQLELEPKATFLETMRELCGLFISVSDSRIYLIHQTAREFLLATKSERQLLPRATGTWMYSMDYQASHFELAKTSLLYLHLCELECQSRVVASHDVVDGVCKPPDFAQRQVFRTYAATQWYYHVSESDSSAVDSLMDLMLSITTPDSHAFKTWMAFRSRKPVYSPHSVAEQLADLDQLSVAACFGVEPVLNSLLKVKQHLIDQKPMIYRAATRAIEYCPGVFHHFLDNGLDVESRIEDSRSFMHEAARFDCVEVAQLLIGAGHLVNCEDKDLREQLFLAVGNYAWAMVSLLIENGALVNHRDARGETVLYQAVRLQSLRMITELLEHGAEHDLTDFSGRTPLSWAADDLSRVVGGPAYSIAKLLIEHGAKIGSSDNEGRTPLEYTVAAGSWDIVALLIENGAPVDSIDRDGRTPLSHAAEDRRGPIIDLLVKRSAQVNTKCIEMRTPLSYAAGSCRTPQIKSLLENGAAVDDSDWRCNTPLMYAAQVDIDNSQLAWQRRFPGASFPHVGIGSIQHSVKVLLAQGANPVAVNEDGSSPLLILERLAPRHWRHLTQEKSEAVKNDIRNLLRHHGADGIKSPTSSDVLSQVVVLLTAKLIEIIRNSKACATRDYEVASKSSIQLFRRWRLHPTVSSITVQDNKTIEQEITEFVQNQWEQTARIISCSQPRPINDLDIAKAEDLASRNEYGGLSPLQMSDHCSYFLQRLAELQQRLFNVNTCLYYIESNPEDCSETIDELISKATRPQSQNDEYGGSCDSESDHELSCQGLLGSCDVG